MKHVIGTMRLTRAAKAERFLHNTVRVTWNPTSHEIRVGNNQIGHAKGIYSAAHASLDWAKKRKHFLKINKRTEKFISGNRSAPKKTKK
jgi:hypothetical protein